MPKESSQSKIKILLLITQMERAGAQKVLITLAHYFHQRGYDVSLCFLYDKAGIIPELKREVPFHVFDLQAKQADTSGLFNIFYTIRASIRLYAQLTKSKTDIILTFTHYSNILGILVAALARTPIRISSQRNTLDESPRWFLKVDAWVANSSLIDKMIAVSEHTRQFCINVEGIAPEKLITIPNGINTQQFEHLPLPQEEQLAIREHLGISPTTKVLMTVARLHPQKGHRYLLEAATKILQHSSDITFVFVGEGELREEFETTIHTANQSQYFRLLGSRTDIPNLLGIADIFILPSVAEGMPNVLLEAMAARLPIIATRVDGSIEIVEDGKTGLLVERRNPEALATAIMQLLDDPHLCHSMGNAGFQRVQQHFSEALMCQRYEELMDDLLNNKHLSKTKNYASNDS